ncbi:hypothetical protein [Halorhabdus rudnickae]|uniref:hypothetical protein n=1 Tax=Halorhabdus rudnickae TaxID=1775544 RepID=UPI0010839122|nr:hypothetical protein [Halorhabdus rudnickae]
MTASTPGNTGWFEDVDPDDVAAAAASISEGSAERPQAWPNEAIDAGFVDDESEYYDRLRDATIEATDAAVAERERADDQQLIHAVRSMDDKRRILL